MIKINLLGDDTVVDHSGKLWIAAYVASVVMLLITFLALHQRAAHEIEDLTASKETKERELEKLKAKTQEVRNLEGKKRELAAKLTVIASLKKSKVGPVRILDDLSTAIPDRAWITELEEKSGTMMIQGMALDNQTIANFMEELDRSNYFDAVELDETVGGQRQGVPIKVFKMRAAVSYAGKVTLPKAEPEVKEPPQKKPKAAAKSSDDE
jgi:type IV pilus assembly protein PilN